jgi:nitroreductase
MKKHKEDKYQSRYLAHQLKKKEVLKRIIEERHSTREFSGEEIDIETIESILNSIEHCPSSCDRQAISITLIEDRDHKDLLGGLLVGGTGWIHRADKILLIFANADAYKEKLVFMPFLDAGVVIYHLYLMAEYFDLKACYVNPNIRIHNLAEFQIMFGDGIFCGAMALGYEKK